MRTVLKEIGKGLTPPGISPVRSQDFPFVGGIDRAIVDALGVPHNCDFLSIFLLEE
jgi:hypothetical protein